jgi:hypothetical protein
MLGLWSCGRKASGWMAGEAWLVGCDLLRKVFFCSWRFDVVTDPPLPGELNASCSPLRYVTRVGYILRRSVTA